MRIKTQRCSRSESHDFSCPAWLALLPAEASGSLFPLCHEGCSSPPLSEHTSLSAALLQWAVVVPPGREEKAPRNAWRAQRLSGLTPPQAEGVGCCLTAGDLERKCELCSMSSFANLGSGLKQSAEQHVELYYSSRCCDGWQEQSQS